MNTLINQIAEKGVLVVIAGMVLYFAYKFINIYLKKIEVKVETNLKNHGLFNYLKNSLEHHIDTIELSDDKKILFSVLLKVKFESFIGLFYELIDNDINYWNKDKLERKNIDLLNKATKSYEDKLNMLGFPDLVLDKFKTWHYPHVQGVLDGVRSTCNSDYFPTNIARQASIFYAYYSGFHMTIIDAHKTLKSLNGELAKWIKDNPKKINYIRQNGYK